MRALCPRCKKDIALVGFHQDTLRKHKSQLSGEKFKDCEASGLDLETARKKWPVEANGGTR
jgi:hypothetical protein